MKHDRDRQQSGFPALLAIHASVSPFALSSLIALLTMLVPAPSLADGGLVGPWGEDIWEPAQKAVILWDQETQREDLVLQVDFIGETKDFGWIVPVPALPELAPADAQIFHDLSDLTKPIYMNRGRAWGCMGGNNGVATPDDFRQEDITIYDEQVVGIYQTLTLGADNAAPLLDSLQAWGYLHDTNQETVEEALQFYIDKSWYFVAMKMDSSSALEQNYDGHWYGGIDPIQLTFNTPEPVYPLRISAISARNPSQVLLYVCAPHRVDFPDARTDYANNLDDEEYSYIKATYGSLSPLLQKPCFVTKLRKSFMIDEMDSDLILEPAATNEEYRRIYEYSSLPGEPLLLAMTGIFFVGWAGVKRRKRSAE